MSLDVAVFGLGVLVSFLVAAGAFLAYYTPAYREEARKDGVAVTGEVRRAVDYLTGHDTRP